jgi:DNA-directed RNA polymerase alpha subunit
VTNPHTENERQAYLDWLYLRSGRTCGTYTGLYAERISQLIKADMVASKRHPLRLLAGTRMHLADLELPTAVYNPLRRAGYQYVDEIEHLSDAELLTVKQIGPGNLQIIREALTISLPEAA